MNKTELIAAMSEVSGLTKKDCEVALAAFTGTVETAMKSGDKVQLVGFGSFEAKERPARVGRNPRTSEPMDLSRLQGAGVQARQGAQRRHTIKQHSIQ